MGMGREWVRKMEGANARWRAVMDDLMVCMGEWKKVELERIWGGRGLVKTDGRFHSVREGMVPLTEREIREILAQEGVI